MAAPSIPGTATRQQLDGRGAVAKQTDVTVAPTATAALGEPREDLPPLENRRRGTVNTLLRSGKMDSVRELFTNAQEQVRARTDQ